MPLMVPPRLPCPLCQLGSALLAAANTFDALLAAGATSAAAHSIAAEEDSAELAPEGSIDMGGEEPAGSAGDLAAEDGGGLQPLTGAAALQHLRGSVASSAASSQEAGDEGQYAALPTTSPWSLPAPVEADKMEAGGFAAAGADLRASLASTAASSEAGEEGAEVAAAFAGGVAPALALTGLEEEEAAVEVEPSRAGSVDADGEPQLDQQTDGTADAITAAAPAMAFGAAAAAAAASAGWAGTGLAATELVGTEEEEMVGVADALVVAEQALPEASPGGTDTHHTGAAGASPSSESVVLHGSMSGMEPWQGKARRPHPASRQGTPCLRPAGPAACPITSPAALLSIQHPPDLPGCPAQQPASS